MGGPAASSAARPRGRGGVVPGREGTVAAVGTRVDASRPLVLSGGSLLRALIPCTPELRLALPTVSHVVL